MKTVVEHAPLTPAVFYILLALATNEKHGYEIMKQVKQDTQGKVNIGNGTLYGSIKRMLTDKLIQDAGDKIDPDNTRRKYYKLTPKGKRVLNNEMKRYVEAVEIIKVRQLLPALDLDLTL